MDQTQLPVELRMAKRGRKGVYGRRAAAVIVPLALVILLGFIRVKAGIYLGEGQTPDADTAQPEEMTVYDAAETETPSEDKSLGTELEEGVIEYNGERYRYNNEFKTYLIMGINKQAGDDTPELIAQGITGGEADSIFLLAVNRRDDRLYVISVNRNTMTDIGIYDTDGNLVRTQRGQLTLQHSVGTGGDDSCGYMVEAVSELLYELPIHGYIAIDLAAVGPLTDAVGGLDITMDEDASAPGLHYRAGDTVHLSGDTAVKFVQSRDTGEFASADARARRHVLFVKEYMKKLSGEIKQDPPIITTIYSAVRNNLVSDLELSGLSKLGIEVAGIDAAGRSFTELPGETVDGGEFEEFIPDTEGVRDMIMNIFYDRVE